MRAAIFYILAVVSANLTATLFIPVGLFGDSEVLVSVGTLIFGLTFTQRDRMHYKGRRFVYTVILIAALLSSLLLTSFKFVWGAYVIEFFGNQGWSWLEEGSRILAENGWRVFLASFLATVIAEITDTEVYHRLINKSWLTRVAGSNAVSIPVDSVLFNLIAFAGSPFFPLLTLIKVIAGEIVAKYVVGFAYAFISPCRSSEPREGARNNNKENA